MGQRPLSISILSWISIASGTVGLIYHASEFNVEDPFDLDFLSICLLRLLAIVCGVYMLQGSNWARWVVAVWLGSFVVLGAMHDPYQLLMHGLLFAVVVYFLFRRKESAFFRGDETGALH